MNPWPVFENGPGGGTQRSHRSAECNPPIRTVSLGCLGEFLGSSRNCHLPLPFLHAIPGLFEPESQHALKPCFLQNPAKLKNIARRKSSGAVRRQRCFASFGRPPGELPAGVVLLRFPGPLGRGAWACSGMLCPCWQRQACHGTLGQRSK